MAKAKKKSDKQPVKNVAKKSVKDSASRAEVKASKKPSPKVDLKADKKAGKADPKAAKVDVKKAVSEKSSKAPAKPSAKPLAKIAEAAPKTEKRDKKVQKNSEEQDAQQVVETEVVYQEVQVSTVSSLDDEIILTDAEGRRLCRVRDCDQASTVDGYCRFHYLLLWKKIQVRKKIIEDGKLSKYVEDLTSRYPDKFLEMIRKDLRSEKDFLAAIAELEIDEAGLDNDFEDEIQNDIEEVRGVTTESSGMSDDDF